MGTPLIAFFGPDGSGKSTLADATVASIEEDGIPCRRMHWRPGFLIPYRSGAVLPSDPHGWPQKPLILGLIALVAYLLDFLAHRLRLFLPSSVGGVVVAERYAGDLVIDPRRYGMGGLSVGLLRVLPSLVPRPSLSVFLHGDAEAVRERKPELPVVEIERQLVEIRRLAAHCRAGLMVDTVALGLDESVDLVIGEMRKRDMLPSS